MHESTMQAITAELAFQDGKTVVTSIRPHVGSKISRNAERMVMEVIVVKCRF